MPPRSLRYVVLQTVYGYLTNGVAWSYNLALTPCPAVPFEKPKPRPVISALSRLTSSIMQAEGEFVPNAEKLAKLQRMAAGVRTGGKGSVRRKSKKARTALPVDDKRLQSTLKKLQLSQLPGIEEVNIIRDNNTFISFASPKVQAHISANTYVVSGTTETKPLSELAVNNQAGEMAQVQAMMEQLEASGKMPANLKEQMASAMAGGGMGAAPAADDDDDDDDIPDLVENSNFEETAKAEE